MSKTMNEKLKQMLYRCDLDRPILMRDKLDFIWSKDVDDKIVDQFEVKSSLNNRKLERQLANQKQSQAYNKLLNEINSRKTKITA